MRIVGVCVCRTLMRKHVQTLLWLWIWQKRIESNWRKKEREGIKKEIIWEIMQKVLHIQYKYVWYMFNYYNTTVLEAFRISNRQILVIRNILVKVVALVVVICYSCCWFLFLLSSSSSSSYHHCRRSSSHCHIPIHTQPASFFLSIFTHLQLSARKTTAPAPKYILYLVVGVWYDFIMEYCMLPYSYSFGSYASYILCSATGEQQTRKKENK